MLTYIGTLGKFICGHHLNIEMLGLGLSPGLYQPGQNLNHEIKKDKEWNHE